MDTSSGDTVDVGVPATRVMAIVTPESYSSFRPDMNVGRFSVFQEGQEGQSSGDVVFVEPAANAEAESESTVPDPSAFFKIGSRFLWNEMDALVEAIGSEEEIRKNGMFLSVTVHEDDQDQAIFMVELTTDNNMERVTRTIFIDGKNGFNIIIACPKKIATFLLTGLL